MTYGGTFGGATTLAHELGHAHHSWLLRERPYYATSYPMTLAETASTFCEGLLISAALDETTDAGVRLRLLDRMLEEAVSMLMNLRSRFLFEIDFYRQRASGPLTAAELDELMVAAQRRAYCDAVAADGYHPLFWASKMHFYFTDVPFYNFPYVVGYLLASGSGRAGGRGGAGVRGRLPPAACRHRGHDLRGARRPPSWRRSGTTRVLAGRRRPSLVPRGRVCKARGDPMRSRPRRSLLAALTLAALLVGAVTAFGAPVELQTVD